MKPVLYTDLKDVFKSNSLVNLTNLSKNSPSPHSGNQFYIWYEIYNEESELSNLLNKGNKWSVSEPSTCSYISLSDDCYNNKYYCIEYGPNSKSSSNTVRVIKLDNCIRIIANGWGSSYIVLWEGPEIELVEYLKTNQPR